MTSSPTRRRILGSGLAGTGALLVGFPTLTGCSSDDSGPDTPDPLIPLARRARQDAADADAVAEVHSELAAAAGAVAADRRAHADALDAELRRAAGADAPTTLPPVPPAAPAAEDRDGARTAVVDALWAAEAEAAGLVLQAPAHRAALLGAVAACCASHQAVFP